MTITSEELLAAIEALSPADRAEVETIVRTKAEQDRAEALDLDEWRRRLLALHGTISHEDAEELIRIRNETFDVIEAEMWR